jgi:hypothetical protein
MPKSNGTPPPVAGADETPAAAGPALIPCSDTVYYWKTEGEWRRYTYAGGTWTYVVVQDSDVPDDCR